MKNKTSSIIASIIAYPIAALVILFVLAVLFFFPAITLWLLWNKILALFMDLPHISLLICYMLSAGVQLIRSTIKKVKQ